MGVVPLSYFMFKMCTIVVDCWIFLSFSTWPSSVAMEGGDKQRKLVEFGPENVSKCPLFITCSNVLGVGLKRQPWIYVTIYVFNCPL